MSTVVSPVTVESIDARIAGVFSHIAAWRSGEHSGKHPDVCWRLVDRLLDERIELTGRPHES